jgi:dCMP deaminase
MLVYSRPKTDEYFLAMAQLVSARATCRRRRVGCVLVNADKHVLATGYNGVARGSDHCLDDPCVAALLPQGQGLDQCLAIHAEQNALLQCANTQSIYTAYITVSPCITCTKLLLNTGCKRIVFIESYIDKTPRNIWKGEWIEYGSVVNVFADLSVAATERVPSIN